MTRTNFPIVLSLFMFPLALAIETLTLGTLVPWTGWSVGGSITGAIQVAVDKANNDILSDTNYRLDWETRDSKCSQKASMSEY